MIQKGLPRPAVFIDRDGTLIRDADYLSSVDDLEVFEYSAEALRMLKECGFLVMVVTNQSGIGRGLLTENEMHSVNDAIQLALGGVIDAFYFCPHRPGDGCVCRKPATGMIEQAAGDFEIDLANSWFVGDKKSDIETGFAAGTGTALVLTGYGESELKELDRMPDIVAGDLLAAAREICLRES